MDQCGLYWDNIMEMIRLEFGVDYKEFAEMSRFFIVSGEILADLKPMYEKFLPTIRKEIKDQFSKEGKPSKWKALKPSYLSSPKKMNSKYPMKILKLTGKMWKAATEKCVKGNICSVSKEGITWGINLKDIPYARLHDMGGKISGKAHGIMPQREFLKLSKEGISRIMQTAHKFIRSNMKSGGIKMD